MKEFLQSTQFINWQHPQVMAQAKRLADGSQSELECSKRCFEFVRDKIKHSWDYQLNPVTCVASDVLKHATGFCYAKSHLLAALLRANGIPTGLCYQRLTINDDKPPFCLHGLNAIFLKDYGWYRVDARGNKEGVQALFIPPAEQLAFTIRSSGEKNFEEIFAAPHPAIIECLTHFQTYQLVADNLPDCSAL